MPKYLLDTNIIISIINNEHPELIKKIKSKDPFEFAISTITYAELVYGYERLEGSEKLKKKLIVDLSLSAFTMLDFNKSASLEYGRIKASLKAKKAYTPKNELDIQIASIATSVGLTLLTKNLKDFQQIDTLDLIDNL